MNTDPGDSGQADYINRRIRRALAFKAMREMRKTVDTMEAEETAGKRAETKIVLGIWTAIVLVFLIVASYIHITKASSPENDTEYLFTGLAGRITSWDTKTSVAAIALSTGEEIECSIYLQSPLQNCTITIFNLKELKSLEGLKLSLHKLDSPPNLKRSLYSLYQEDPKDSAPKNAIGVITASNPL